MKLAINLATRPFVELRPFFLRLRLLMGLLAAVALGLGFLGHSMNVRLQQEQAQMNRLRNETIAAQQEKLRAEASMRQPGNAAVLDRAHFLNRLFLAKSFSWTAVMMDLETVLPVGVQVTSIEPQVLADGGVNIRMKVFGERDRTIALVRNLEHSRRFLEPRLTGESTLAKDRLAGNATPANANVPAGTEFDILARYNPLPAVEAFHFVRAQAPKASSATAPGVRTRGYGRYPRDGVVLPPAAVKGGATR